MKPTSEELESIARRAARRLKAPAALSARVRGGEVSASAAFGVDLATSGVSGALLALAREGGPRPSATNPLVNAMGLASCVFARHEGDDGVVGLVLVGDFYPRDFEPAALTALEDLAREAAGPLKKT